VVVGIITAGVVADPLIVGMHVGSVGMAAFVCEIGMLRGRTGIGSRRSWSVGGDVATAYAVGSSQMLGGRYFTIR
jgi:hypothetical protein